MGLGFQELLPLLSILALALVPTQGEGVGPESSRVSFVELGRFPASPFPSPLLVGPNSVPAVLPHLQEMQLVGETPEGRPASRIPSWGLRHCQSQDETGS